MDEGINKGKQEVAENQIFDLDILCPDKKLTKIDGVVIDLGFIPSEIGLDVVNNIKNISDVINNPEHATPEKMEVVLDIASRTLMTFDEKFTREYMAKKMHFVKVAYILKELMIPIKALLEKKSL